MSSFKHLIDQIHFFCSSVTLAIGFHIHGAIKSVMQTEMTQKSLYEKLHMNDEFECLERPVSLCVPVVSLLCNF